MASIIQHINQRPDIYQNSEFQKQVYLNVDKNYLNQNLFGRNSSLYKINGGHDPKVTMLNPNYDPHFILRQESVFDGKQHIPLLIPCGRPGSVVKQGVPDKYRERNANERYAIG